MILLCHAYSTLFILFITSPELYIAGFLMNTINTNEYHIGPRIHEYESTQVPGFMSMNPYRAGYS